MAEVEVSIWLRIRSKAAARLKKIKRQFPMLARAMKLAAKVGQTAWKMMGRTMQWVGRQIRRTLVIASALAVFMGKQLVKGIMEAGAQAEMFGLQMVRAFGNVVSMAKTAMKWVREFAAKTPFFTEEVVRSFIILKNVGIKNVKETVTAAGDAAFMMGRSIEDVSVAFVSLLARVWRRLGVMIDRTGKKAIISAAGIRREVENDLDAVRKAILEVIQFRFGGAMKAAERTWKGMVALFLSEWWEFRVKIAESGMFTFFKAGLSLILKWIKKMKQEGKLGEWAQQISDDIIGLTFQLAFFAHEVQKAGNWMKWSALQAAGLGLRLGMVRANIAAIDPLSARARKESRAWLQGAKRDLQGVRLELEHMDWTANLEDFDESKISATLMRIQEEMANVTSGMDAFGRSTKAAGKDVEVLSENDKARVKAIEALLGATEKQRRHFRRAVKLMKDINKEEFLRNRWLQAQVASNQMLQGMRPDLIAAFKEEQISMLDISEKDKERLRKHSELQTAQEKVLSEMEKISGIGLEIVTNEEARLGTEKLITVELLAQARAMDEIKRGKIEAGVLPGGGLGAFNGGEAVPFLPRHRQQAQEDIERMGQIRQHRATEQGVIPFEVKINNEWDVDVEVNAEASEIGAETARSLRAALNGPMGELQDEVKKIASESARKFADGATASRQGGGL